MVKSQAPVQAPVSRKYRAKLGTLLQEFLLRARDTNAASKTVEGTNSYLKYNVPSEVCFLCKVDDPHANLSYFILYCTLVSNSVNTSSFRIDESSCRMIPGLNTADKLSGESVFEGIQFTLGASKVHVDMERQIITPASHPTSSTYEIKLRMSIPRNLTNNSFDKSDATETTIYFGSVTYYGSLIGTKDCAMFPTVLMLPLDPTSTYSSPTSFLELISGYGTFSCEETKSCPRNSEVTLGEKMSRDSAMDDDDVDIIEFED